MHLAPRQLTGCHARNAWQAIPFLLSMLLSSKVGLQRSGLPSTTARTRSVSPKPKPCVAITRSRKRPIGP